MKNRFFYPKRGLGVEYGFWKVIVFVGCLGFFGSLWGNTLALDAIDYAELLLEEGDTEKAITLLEPLLHEQDEERLAHVVELLYRIYSEKGEREKAVTTLETYIKKFPHTPSAYLYRYWIAKDKEEQGKVDEAIALLRQFIESYPRDLEDPYELRCQAQEDLAYLWQHAKKDYAQAITAYQKVLSCTDEEDQARIMMEIAFCHERMKNASQAIEQYKKVSQKTQDEFYRRWAQLRTQYLTEKPQGAEKERDALAKKLVAAFEKRDIKALERLAKRGDFWAGVNFSEFEIDTFSRARDYLTQHLASSPHLQVSHQASLKNDEWVIRIDNWGDPEYNILYLVINEGFYGWEWQGIILSSTQLEELLANMNHQEEER